MSQPQYPIYTGHGNAAPPVARPRVPGSVNGAFLIFLITALVAVVGVVISASSDIWDQAAQQASASGAVISVSTLKTILIVVGVLFAALYLFFAFMMRAGRNWARIVLTVLAALSLVSSFSSRASVTVNNRTYTSSSSQLTGWVGVALSVLAIILMFLASSNAYFAASKAARQRR